MPRKNKGPHLWYDKDKDTYFIRWYEHGKRCKKTTSTGDIGLAQESLAVFLLSWRQSGGPSSPDERLIDDCLDAYALEVGVNAVDPERIGYCIDALNTFWLGKKLSDISRNTCKAYAKHRGVSDGTIRRELGCLNAAIGHDYMEGRITRKVPVPLPPKPPSKERWLTRKEAADLIRSARKRRDAKDYLPLFILIALYTGQRSEAILSLRWPQITADRINFHNKEVTTKKKRPIVPIHRRLKRFLDFQRKRGTQLGYVLHRNQKPIKSVKKSFKACALDCGWNDVTAHTLRHTCASWMAQRSVRFEVISKFLGHDDVRTTERIYAHHSPSYLDDALEAFD
ncbi:tyrosine-type recombinase/integrase [Terasakiella sp.]|uniref:tyrosine-type recombinase/integrase n=1 Tax=Terasakiella sp. TaxID=2034861 RepID=UPI003AA93EC0